MKLSIKNVIAGVLTASIFAPNSVDAATNPAGCPPMVVSAIDPDAEMPDENETTTHEIAPDEELFERTLCERDAMPAASPAFTATAPAGIPAMARSASAMAATVPANEVGICAVLGGEVLDAENNNTPSTKETCFTKYKCLILTECLLAVPLATYLYQAAAEGVEFLKTNADTSPLLSQVKFGSVFLTGLGGALWIQNKFLNRGQDNHHHDIDNTCQGEDTLEA